MVQRIASQRPRSGRYFTDEQLHTKDSNEATHLVRAPHTFVITQGKTDKVERELCADLRKIMEPFTAAKLRTKRKNTLRDFVAMAGFFHVTHMLVLNKTVGGKMYLRVTNLPRGPTLTFEVQGFTTAGLVRKQLKKVVQMANQHMTSPLLVQSNFNGEGMHFKLMSTMFQNMLPSININRVNLNSLKRCLLIHYNEGRDVIEWRHYSVKVAPTGIVKAAKKLVERKVPNLGDLKDISDFVDNPGGSESEAEELCAGTNRVKCPDEVRSRGNIPGQQSTLRLYELGPRMTLKLVRIEEGLCSGRMLYGANNDVPNLPQYQTKPDEIAPVPKKRKRPEKEKKKRTPQEKHAAKMQRRAERRAAEAKLGGGDDNNMGDGPPAKRTKVSGFVTSKERTSQGLQNKGAVKKPSGKTSGSGVRATTSKKVVHFNTPGAYKKPLGIVRGFAKSKQACRGGTKGGRKS
ncbi:protein Peter pan-like [Varroa jacobsoni]|uniref:Brix domain-containing protein n=1 Tax=Varroa destructor TaxID=109461 RepID=A0A7M7MBP1_VARDE|nr:protein Peter pan-like [Varroa destructor]XP_022691139.1 protein Peter pan-like [Varroa jacobsoni]